MRAYVYKGAIWVSASSDVTADILPTDVITLRKLAYDEEIVIEPTDPALMPIPHFESQFDVGVVGLDAVENDASVQRILKAKERFRAVTLEESGEMDARQAAELCGLSLSRYRELKRAYDPSIGYASLMSNPRGRQAGTRALKEEVENIIQSTYQRFSNLPASGLGALVIEAVWEECMRRDLPNPSPSTVRNRIKDYASDRMNTVKGSMNHYVPHRPSSVSEPGLPLQHAAIAYARLNGHLCDENGIDVGVPYATVLFCLETEVVAGFAISVRPPSAASIAAAVMHAVNPKDDFMRDLGLDEFKYTFSGMMGELQVGQNRAFQTVNLQRACASENIQLSFAVAERVNGVFERIWRGLGFSSWSLPTLEDLGDYDEDSPQDDRLLALAQAHAPEHLLCTVREATRVLTLRVCGYHEKVHYRDGKSPSQRWDERLVGSDGRLLSLPVLQNPQRFAFELMPQKMSTVQRRGITVNTVVYSSRELAPFVGSKVRVKFDPQNLQRVYVSVKDRWIEVPAISKCSQTLTELHVAKAAHRKPGHH